MLCWEWPYPSENSNGELPWYLFLPIHAHRMVFLHVFEVLPRQNPGFTTSCRLSKASFSRSWRVLARSHKRHLSSKHVPKIQEDMMFYGQKSFQKSLFPDRLRIDLSSFLEENPWRSEKQHKGGKCKIESTFRNLSPAEQWWKSKTDCGIFSGMFQFKLASERANNRSCEKKF